MSLSFTVEESVQGFSTSTSGMGIDAFVDLGYCIEQAPRCPREKLRVTRLTPFT